MQTRTRNALVLAVVGALLTVGLLLVWRHRRVPDLRARSLDAVPNGALLVGVVDLPALRNSPVGAPLFREGREIPGMGKVRDVCGFDPIDDLRELAFAVPAAGEAGDFGLVGTGALDPDALLACASKVIEARGGHAVVTGVGSFRSVHDATLVTSGGEIAIRGKPGGESTLLLGGGTYLRAMIDAADGRAPSIRASVAHTNLGKEIEDGAVRVTFVLTPEQRSALADDLAAGRADAKPLLTLVGGALGVRVNGPTVSLHAVLACDDAPHCNDLATALRAARDERASDLGVRLVGFGQVLEAMHIDAAGDVVHVRVDVEAEQAATLVDRLMTLRGIRHPMPEPEDRSRARVPDDTRTARPQPEPPATAKPRSSAAPR